MRDRETANHEVSRGMQKAPALQTRLTGHGKRLSLSLFSGAIGTGVVCGALALIVKTHLLFQEAVDQQESLTITYVEPVRKAKPQVATGPQRLITTPAGPAFVRVQPTTPQTEAPKFVEVPPTIETTPDLLVMEELDSENPFEVKPEPKKTVKSTAVVKNTTPAKRTGPSQADLARREQQRIAGLAKKITRNASVLSLGKASYPTSARRKGLQGLAVVLVTVGPSGKVSSCQLTQSSGHSSLDRSALSAARRSRFRPAINGLGQAVSVKKAIPFKFQLSS